MAIRKASSEVRNNGRAHAANPQREGSIKFGPVLGFVAVWLGGSWLVVGALLLPALPGGWFAVAAVIVLCAIPVYMLLRGLSGATYPSALTRLLVFRPFWYLMLFMPLLAGAGIVGAVAGLPFEASRVAGTWSLAAVAALLAVASLVGYAGARQLVVRQLDVRLPNLPDAFEGLRIVQVSDVHVGPHTSRRHLTRIADAVRDAQPDMVVYTGDQVDDFTRDVEHFVTAFGDVTATLGAFAIAGNHDVIAGWNGVRQGLSDAGITVLVNAAVPVERGGERIWLAGTGDPAGNSWHRGGGLNAAPDIERTLSRIPPGEPTIALAHNPALWPDLARCGVDLTLSGHTHYGQLAIPDWGWNIASSFLDLSMGVHRQEDSLLYINPGTNYWGVPFRIGTSPEVTVLILRRSEHGEPPSIDPAAGSDRRHGSARIVDDARRSSSVLCGVCLGVSLSGQCAT
jgi:predicted MPP superfamily phosphohydrolase